MGLFGKMLGKSFDKLAAKGDAYLAEQQYGPAKLAYDDALRAADKDVGETARSAVEDKLAQARHGLAEFNAGEAERLVELGDLEETVRLVELCQELTDDPAILERLEPVIARVEEGEEAAHARRMSAAGLGQQQEAGPGAGDDSEGFGDSLEDRFEILLGSLPGAQADEYRGLGTEFAEAYLTLNEGGLKQASEVFEKIYTEHPDSAHLGYEVARLRGLAGRLEESCAAYEPLLEEEAGLHPEVRLKAMLELGDCRCRLEQYAAAEELAVEAVEEFPGRTEPLVGLARVLRRAGEIEDALAAARKAMAEDPQEVAGHVEAALAFDAMGDIESARELALVFIASSRGVPDLDQADAERLVELVKGE